MGSKKTPHRPRIRRGDTVQVITGEDRGKTGRVLRLIADKSEIVIEGVNLVYRHVRRSQKNPQGGRVRRESPVSISNVMLLDPADNLPTRLGRRPGGPEEGGEGRMTRFARRSGKPVDVASAKAAKKGKKSKE